MKASSNSEWTFLAISFRNVTSAARPQQETTVFTNLGTNRELLAAPTCLYDDVSFFNAIEVNYPMLISPIMMVPEALPASTLQQEYLENVEEMSIRQGPTVENSVRMSTRVPVTKREFGPRSTLMAPPVIFQTRSQPTAQCPYRYSSEYVVTQQGKASADKCAPPFKCHDSVLENDYSVMSCRGPVQETGFFFGLPVMNFLGQKGFADFLYSITDNDFLFRADSPQLDTKGELKNTDTFIDALTESVQIVLVFFTPADGITSVLTVFADMSGVCV